MNQKSPKKDHRKAYTPPKLEKVSLATDESVLQVGKCKTTGMAFGPGGFGCIEFGTDCRYVNS